MKIFFAGDHAFAVLKQALLPFVVSLGYEAEDLGSDGAQGEDDYPDFVTPCAKRVANEGAFGIIGGGSGQGEAMCANRVEGVRAAVFCGGSLDTVRVAREHNDANVLSLGARFISEAEAKDAVQAFLETSFSREERHARRLAKF